MKYILEYNEFIDEKINFFGKKSPFNNAERGIGVLWLAKDLLHKKLTLGDYGSFKTPFNLKNIVKYGSIATGLIGIIIAIIYYKMWQHDKKIDSELPYVKSVLSYYSNYLKQEFSPKELDDLYKIISTDENILVYIYEYFDNKNVSKEAIDYINKKLTKRQIEGIGNIQRRIYGTNVLEALSIGGTTANNDNDYSYKRTDFDNMVDMNIKNPIQEPLTNMIKSKIRNKLFSLPIIFFLNNKFTSRLMDNQNMDPTYIGKFIQLSTLIKGQFSDKDYRKFLTKLMDSQRFVSYLQRLSRCVRERDIKDLELVMFEHIIEILSDTEIAKIKNILAMGTKLGIFDGGRFTFFDTMVDASTSDMINTGFGTLAALPFGKIKNIFKK